MIMGPMVWSRYTMSILAQDNIAAIFDLASVYNSLTHEKYWTNISPKRLVNTSHNLSYSQRIDHKYSITRLATLQMCTCTDLALPDTIELYVQFYADTMAQCMGPL